MSWNEGQLSYVIGFVFASLFFLSIINVNIFIHNVFQTNALV
jgi:hypothetical protein